MLKTLSIRNLAVLPAMDLELGPGLTALTGETGSGKSVLLSAIAFALGRRSASLRGIGPGASVSATFQVATDHAARRWLAQHGIDVPDDGQLTFRREAREGRSTRAWLNDRPVGVGLIESVGGLLVDLHDQHESVGLAALTRQRDLLDAHACAGEAVAAVARAAERQSGASARRRALEADVEREVGDRAYLDHMLAELHRLDPEPGEATKLANERAELQAQQRFSESVDQAMKHLEKAGAESALAAASRVLSRALQSSAAGAAAEASFSRLIEARDGLDRALSELSEAAGRLSTSSFNSGSMQRVEAVEARLFALRAAARKHNVDADLLADVRRRLEETLVSLDHMAEKLGAATAEEAAAYSAYVDVAAKLSALRRRAAERLSAQVNEEFGPLRLGGGRFRISVTSDPAFPVNSNGVDMVAFEFSSGQQAGFSPLGRTASGGEMARVSLALSVCLASDSPVQTLVFDEADVGVGGAVAAAVGERLARLGRSRQVLAVTHSPQVAAAAQRQLCIVREEGAATVRQLAPRARREEIARMLAGARVTPEARAAADRLLAGA